MVFGSEIKGAESSHFGNIRTICGANSSPEKERTRVNLGGTSARVAREEERRTAAREEEAHRVAKRVGDIRRGSSGELRRDPARQLRRDQARLVRGCGPPPPSWGRATAGTSVRGRASRGPVAARVRASDS